MYIVLLTLLFLCLPFCVTAICRTIEILGRSRKIKTPELLDWVGVLTVCFAIILLLLEFVLIIGARTRNYAKNKYYSEWRNMIERVASVNGLDNNTIKEIYQYNYEVKIQRYYLENKWTNWFASPTIAKQPLLDMNELRKGNNVHSG